jgi:hypothetical protein
LSIEEILTSGAFRLCCYHLVSKKQRYTDSFPPFLQIFSKQVGTSKMPFYDALQRESRHSSWRMRAQL